jgi:peptide/nickel transport system permease protein
MGKYILRRLIIALPSLLGISLILFVLLALAPGDPFGELATNSNIPPEVRSALRVKFGIDDPIFVRYLRWRCARSEGSTRQL